MVKFVYRTFLRNFWADLRTLPARCYIIGCNRRVAMSSALGSVPSRPADRRAAELRWPITSVRTKMKSKKRIALAFPTGVPHFQRVLHGIVGYARTHGDWAFSTSPETFSVSIDELKENVGRIAIRHFPDATTAPDHDPAYGD